MPPLGKVFRRRGHWYRQGKLDSYRLTDRDDTSGPAYRDDERCGFCRRKEPHSRLAHLNAVAAQWDHYRQDAPGEAAR